MKLRLLYFELKGVLYCGYGLEYPVLAWSKDDHCWTKLGRQRHRNRSSEVEQLSDEEAERCYPGCTVASLPKDVPTEKECESTDLIKYRPDLFDTYDCRSIRKSPREILAEEERAKNLIRQLRR